MRQFMRASNGVQNLQGMDRDLAIQIKNNQTDVKNTPSSNDLDRVVAEGLIETINLPSVKDTLRG